MLASVSAGSGSPLASTPAIPALRTSHANGAPSASSTSTVASLTSGPMPSPGMSVAGILSIFVMSAFLARARIIRAAQCMIPVVEGRAGRDTVADDKKDKGLEKGLTSYGDRGFSLFLRRAFIKGAGYTDDALSRPVVGIVNTGSAFNPCHGNAPQLVEAVKRGVMLAGGLPVEFPTISIHESFAHPTSMYLRNLMSMDTEEMIRAQPMDAVVLIGGCDKTVPAQLMGAASAGVPAIQLVTGSMLTGAHRGERVGACTDCRRYWARFRGGEIAEEEVGAV